MEQRNKRVIILGMGRTGQAVCRYLTERGAICATFDDLDPDPPRDLFCRPYDYAVISPGISLQNPSVEKLKQRGVPVLSEIDLSSLECSSKHVFAISGTNGKTTTSVILHTLLSEVGVSHLVGNVGVPWIGKVEKITSRDVVVLEISSFQIEQSALFRPEIAALTNVGEDHLDRHLTKERYQKIKLSLLDKAERKVVNSADPLQRGTDGAITYSDQDPAADYYLSGRAIYAKGRKYTLPKISRGAAYDLDFLCAFAVASSFCGAKKSFLSAYNQVVVPSFRRQYIGTLCGAKVFNDSKGTNIDATLFASAADASSTALILGGSDKGEDYSRLFLRLPDSVKRVYLTGANSRDLYLAAGDPFRDRCRLMPDLESAVSDFASDPLEVLLFSPASASFDRYSNYEERGREFNEIVRKYARDDDARS